MPSGRLTAEIICVGDEILMGRTLDTNSNWLSKRLYELGARIRRITVVGDDVDEIASAVKEACNRRSDLLMVTGGLGPTYDDKTLQGIALSAGLSLTFSEEAWEMVKESVKRRGVRYSVDDKSLQAGRKKMATIPEGSKPLMNPVGTAPGVFLRVGNTDVISLPGVPSEMMGIFDSSIVKILSAKRNVLKNIDVIVYGVPEAAMAGVIEELVSRYPDIYIKSHPAGYEKVSKVVVQFTGRGKHVGQVEEAVTMFREWLDKRKSSYELAR